MEKLNFEKLIWIHEPQLYLCRDDKLLIETDPFSELNARFGRLEAAEMLIPVSGNFRFEGKVEFSYDCAFDQCGFVLYNGDRRKMFFGTVLKDKEMMRLESVVFHRSGGDRSGRDIGTAIRTMHYRILQRSGRVLVQYSFTGRRWTDLREFLLNEDEEITGISLYACSPFDGSFDCVFTDFYINMDAKEDDI